MFESRATKRVKRIWLKIFLENLLLKPRSKTITMTIKVAVMRAVPSIIPEAVSDRDNMKPLFIQTYKVYDARRIGATTNKQKLMLPCITEIRRRFRVF